MAPGQVPVAPAESAPRPPPPPPGYAPPTSPYPTPYPYPYPYPYAYPYGYPARAPLEPPEQPPKIGTRVLPRSWTRSILRAHQLRVRSREGSQDYWAGPALEALLGGTPLAGLVVGGGLLLYAIQSPGVEQEGVRLDPELRRERGRPGGVLDVLSRADVGLAPPGHGGSRHWQGGSPRPAAAATRANPPASARARRRLEGWISSRWSLGGRLRFHLHRAGVPSDPGG